MNRKTNGGECSHDKKILRASSPSQLPKMNEPLKRYTQANDGTGGVGLAHGAKLLTGLD